MVLTRPRFHLPHFRLPHLQPIRYTSMSAAIAVNVAVALLLSLPKEHTFEPPPPKAAATDVIFLPPPPVVEIQPVPPLPEPPKPIERSQEVVQVELTKPVIDAPVIETPNQMSTFTEAEPPTTETAETTGPVAPVSQGASVAYETAPPPRYPRDLERAGVTGKVLLRILVSPTGNPEQVEVETSSGRAAFDRAARDQVLRRWKFHPALRNGEPVRAWVRVPIEFKLH